MKELNTILPREGFVRLPQILAYLSISKTCFYKGIKDGRFPVPVKLTKRTSAWRVEDIRRIASCEDGNYA